MEEGNTWKFDESLRLPSNVLQSRINNVTDRLIITEVQLHNEGLYSCSRFMERNFLMEGEGKLEVYGKDTIYHRAIELL